MSRRGVGKCEEDFLRRDRAIRDCGVTEDIGNGMTRTIEFVVGYDHRGFPEDCGGGGHGQSGMDLIFRLTGPRGTVDWAASMSNWVPGNVDTINHVKAINPSSLEHTMNAVVGVDVARVPSRYPEIGDGMSMGISYHTVVPQFEGQEEYGTRECQFVPGGRCYSDWAGLAGGEVLKEFLEHGPHAVWAALARRYSELKEPSHD